MPVNEYDALLEHVDGNAPATNPYDAIVGRMKQQQTVDLRATMQTATKQAPDAAAQTAQIADRLKVPVDLVQRNPELFKQQDAVERTPYDQIIEHSPKLADWLKTPTNAAVAHDDLATLGTLEWLVKMPSHAIAQTLNEQAYGSLRTASLFRDLTQAEHDQLESYRYQAERDRKLGAGDSWFAGALTKSMKLLTTLTAPQVRQTAIGTVAGGIIGGVAGSFVGPEGTLAGAAAGARFGAKAGYTVGLAQSTFEATAGPAYDKYSAMTDEVGRPMDSNVAKGAALAEGAINAALMAGAGHVIAQSIPGLDKLGGAFARDALTQALRTPTIRAAIGEAVKRYGVTLAEGTGLMVGQEIASIVIGELAKSAAPGTVPGQVEPGNVNLFKQPKVTNADGSVSTVDSLSVNIEGKEVLLPTVTPDGRHFTGTLEEKTKQAINEYQKTGRHLGIFESPAAATAFAEKLHEDYAAGRYDRAGKHLTPGEIAADLVRTGADAVQSFALISAAGPVLGLAADVHKAQNAASNAAYFTALGDGVAQSKTAQRSPELAQAFIAHATKDGPIPTVYAPLDTWTTYWQSKGLDPAAVAAEVTGDKAAYETAQRTGEDLAIPTSRYAVKLAPTEHNAYFADELRLAPEEMNGRESKAFTEGLQQQADQAAAAAPTEPTSGDKVREAVRTQLEAAGVEKGAAEAYAALHESAFTTLGERAGVDPLELFNRYGLTVERPELAPTAGEGSTTLNQPLTDQEVALLERRQTSGDAPGGVERRQPANATSASVIEDLRARGIIGGTDRNAPIDARDIGAAARRMLSEDPTIVKRAEAQRRAAMDLPRDERKGGMVTLRQEQRGAITFGKDRQMRIDLLQKADLSTFLHESGHLFLEVLRDVGNEPKASEHVKAELATLDEHLFKDATDATDQHERFARAFEAYLMEGKAPSVELRPVFARFRAWLVGVYRSLRGLNVELSDPVRGVFDRLVASDAAIQQAEADGHIAPLFTTAETAGMNARDFAAYRETVQQASVQAQDDLQRELLRDVQRVQQAWWKAERDQVRADVAKDVHQQPVYRALAAIRKGTHPDGTPLVEGQEPAPLRLDKAELAGRYTPEQLAALRRRQLYAVAGGVSPETVAELTGFSSGDELVRALVEAPSMNAAIDAETATRMTARHGDLLIDGRLPEEAQRAVFGEHRQKVVEAELKALTAGMVKGTIPPASIVRAAAETRIAGTRVRDLRPSQFLMAAQRASQRAFDVLAGGDRIGAVSAKQQEIVNLALYREARDAQARIETSVEYLRSFDKPSKRERIGKVGGDYLDQIDGLRERFDFTKLSLKDVDRRTALAKWAADKAASTGLPVDLPAELLNEARRTNYKDLTVEQMRGLHDGVRMIEHLALFKNKLLKAQAARDLADVATDLTASIADHAKGTRNTGIETRLPGTATTRGIAMFFASHRKLGSLLREMDGFQDGGPLWESIMRPINEAADAEAVRIEQATIALGGLFDDAFKGHETELYHKTFLPAVGTSLTKMARLMVALNWGNEGNRDRIRAGYGWKDEQVRAILDTLDERDWHFVQGVWDHINSYWSDIAAKEKRVTGVAPEKVEAAPVPTKFGEQAGGYFPIKYENQLSPRAGANLEGSFVDGVKQAAYARATTQRGHTEARVAHVAEPVRLDFGVITEHVSQVIHDLTHHEMLLDVGRILSHKDVADAVYKHYGDLVYDQMKGAVRDIAFGNTPAPGWYKTLSAIRAKVVTASLGWNTVTALMHVLQVGRGMVRVGPGEVAHGLVRWLSSAKNAEHSVGWIEEQSDMMRLRWKTQQRELNEVRNAVGLDRGRVSATMHDILAKAGVDPSAMPAIADSYFYLIRRVVQFAEIPTWLGAYEKFMKDPANDDARAIALADQAVIDSMGSGHIKDLAAVQRGTFSKLFSTFYDYHNAVLQQAHEVVKKDANFGRKLVDASLLLFAPVAFSVGVHAALTHSKSEQKKTFVRKYIEGGADYLLGMFVVGRELEGALTHPDWQGPAGLHIIPTARQFVFRAGEAVGKTVRGEPQTKTFPHLVESANDLGGALFGYPARQIERTAQGLQALWAGKTRNLSAVVFGPPPEGQRAAR